MIQNVRLLINRKEVEIMLYPNIFIKLLLLHQFQAPQKFLIKMLPISNKIVISKF